MYDYRVSHCLLSKPDCLFEGQSICGEGMLYDLDPGFEDSTFVPQRCSPLVNAGNNFWPDTFNIATDLAGVNRILFDTVDIGAYEVVQPCVSASYQPVGETGPVFRLLKNPTSTNEAIILLANTAVSSAVEVQIFDLAGRLCTNKICPPGDNSLVMIPVNLPAGLYVASVTMEGYKQVLKLLVSSR